MSDIQEIRNLLQKIRDKVLSLTHWRDGNGSAGADYRITQNTTGLREMNEEFDEFQRTRSETCFGKKALQEYTDTLKERRGFRMGDVANIIQLIMLGLIAYEVFSRGGGG